MWNVKQKYSTSCGIACVAMLAEKKHATVLNNAKYTFQERCFGKTTSYTNLDEIKTLLGNFGVSYQKDFKSIDKDIHSQKRFWRNLKGVNLVAVRFHIKDGTEYWHWIIAIRTENSLKIYDPNPQKKISCIDFVKGELPNQKSYCHAKWYLKISQS